MLAVSRVTLPWVWGAPVGMTGLPASAGAAGRRLAVRSVVMAAPPETAFVWVCQLRRAPYSYDWVDNAGRRSPRQADPSLAGLEVGQSFMTIFELAAFTAPKSVTLRMKDGWPSRVFGAITLSYRVEALDAEHTRLTALMWMPPIGRVLGRARRYVLAWGDLLMMRRQLHTLAALATRDTADGRQTSGRR